ncbi:MAG: HAMP domain-containing histidine kinase [Planctomycetes bacterium]|nr:HAMP domain-containing histidine kinase [Planctomycetota bacterium]
MLRRRSISWPITLGTIMIVLLVALIVGWVLLAVNASQYASYWWAVLALGLTFLVLVLVGVVLYLAMSVKEIALNQRQSNFIDSVTHEFKSPISSLKLYLQTLSRRNVPESQQADFYRYMLEDVERLDSLINHLLDAARLDQQPDAAELQDVPLLEVFRGAVESAVHRYGVPVESVQIDAAPSMVHARAMDVEIVFRNLIDNAVKYSMPSPEVKIESWLNGRGTVITRVSDNGPGIPINARRKIFGRFVRLGNELERKQTGTGLGLFIVRTLVRRMRGRVQVRSPLTRGGTVMEVELPGGPPLAGAATPS